MARRRSSSALDDDESDEDGYTSQSLRNAKRARLDTDDDEDVLEMPESPILPDSYRTQPRHGASSTDEHVLLKHQPGSIVRVKLTNFVTYTSAEFQLGPSLNMIIGPNGTGKSTLVCAICLGLGWGPQHLGRAKELGEFVKHGAREAEIEIELAGGAQSRNRNPIIRRLIRKEGNKSTFSINGAQTTHKEVSRLCKSFAIQIDNLCQFLPQDRVVEFAALNPVQLLEQTQRAAAPDHMNEWHEQLKEMRREQKAKMDTRDRHQDTLRDHQARQNLQRADVERMQERQTLTDKLHAYEKLRPFVHYRTAKERYEASKERVAEAKREFAGLQRQVAPIVRALDDKRSYYDKVRQVVRHRKGLVERTDRHAGTLRTKMDNVQTNIEEKFREREMENTRHKQRGKERDKLTREMSLIRTKMEQEPPEFDPAAFNERSREKQRAMRDLQTENQDLGEKRREATNRIRNLEAEKDRAQREIENLKSQAGQQSNVLKQLSNDTWRAWDWIQRNRSMFRGQVYGPPVVSCSVTDQRFAPAVESMLQRGDLVAFTVINRHDFALLGKTAQNQGWKDIHIKEAVRERSEWRPPMSKEQLSHYALDGFLVDFLQGPDPVLSVLCDSLRLHQCAATLQDHSDQQFERLKNSNIARWVTAKASYSVTRRREYGDQAVSTMVRDLKPARVWTDQPVDLSIEREHQSKIRELNGDIEEFSKTCEEYSTLMRANKDKITELNKEKEAIDAEKSDLQKLRGEFEGLRTRLETQQVQYDRILEQIAENAHLLENIDAQADKLILEKGQAAIDYANTVKGLLDLHEELYEAQIVEAEALSELETLQHRNQDVETQIRERQEEIKVLQAENARRKEEAKRLVEQVKAINRERTPEEEALVEDIQETITLEDLEAEIASFSARLTLLHGGDPNAIRDFERRAKKIADLEAKLQEMDTELEQLQARIDDIKAQWEPQLDELVQKISDAFSFNFSKIGCAGQVSIYKAEDFSEWAIQIQVKFREQEQLSILDSHRQSGGERAVSTIFYLMALQSLARSPFRVVDEINQGMDPRNERMVHERMVDIACQEHTSQYFLITPKLLHGLKFHPRMTVHCIASGEYMPTDYRELDFKALVDVALRVKGKA